eukprot:5612642-Amphidinium_carterae.2
MKVRVKFEFALKGIKRPTTMSARNQPNTAPLSLAPLWLKDCREPKQEIGGPEHHAGVPRGWSFYAGKCTDTARQQQVGDLFSRCYPALAISPYSRRSMFPPALLETLDNSLRERS